MANEFSNYDDNVFVLMPHMDEITRAAIFSRYSRTHKGARELWETEFAADVPSGNPSHRSSRASNFFHRVFVEYGDDSVAELASAHIAFEDVSSLAADFLTDTRVGISPLEKSARYLEFDRIVNGQYRYHVPYELPDDVKAEYREYMNFLFDQYREMLPNVKSHLYETVVRRDDLSDRAWESSIRSQACDLVKNLLPAARTTSVGLHGNARAFARLLEKGYQHPLYEVRELTRKAHRELDIVLSPLLDRVSTKAYVPESPYTTMPRLEPGKWVPPVVISYNTASPSAAIDDALLYPAQQAKLSADRRSNARALKQVSVYASGRETRRDKLGRAFEFAHVMFDFHAPYAVYRDFHRHRQAAQQRRPLGFHLGFATPEGLPPTLHNQYQWVMTEAHRRATKLLPKLTHAQAEYLVPRAYYVEWQMYMSLREAAYIIELRSGRQGHPDYRRIAWDMERLLQPLAPFVDSLIVDHETYDLTRGQAEKRIDEKLEALQ